MRALLILGLLLHASAFATAAPVQRELGQRLFYHRVGELPADLPGTGAARKQPLVLDLRYVQADAAAATATQAWIKFYASSRTPVFVLANVETGSLLRAALAHLRGAPGVVVIGRPGRDFTPDVAVTSTPERERRAYEALREGAEMAALVTDNPDKVRNDEASLARDRPLDELHEPGVASPPAPERPPIDAALQRAMHLHRALVALRRL